MIRPIKFRGRTDDGKLIYGDLVQIKNVPNIFIAGINSWEDQYYKVDPDSVAQLVGYDSDGNEVYEGDKVVGELACEDFAELRIYPALEFTKLKEAVK